MICVSSFSSCHFCLSTFVISSLQFHIFVAIFSAFFSNSFYVSFNAILRHNFALFRLLFSHTFLASARFVCFSSPVPSMRPVQVSLRLTNLFLKHSNLHSWLIHSSLISSLNSHDSITRLFFANLELLLLFLY